MEPRDPAKIIGCIIEELKRLEDDDAIDELNVDLLYMRCIPNDMNEAECWHVIEWLVNTMNGQWLANEDCYKDCYGEDLAALGKLLWNIVMGYRNRKG